MTYTYGDNHTVKQDFEMDQAHIKAGIKQMLDMCEWLEMETSVEFDWRKWVLGYEECPVDDHHLLTGNHKALFVQMINLCPNFDACVQAWNEYSEIFVGWWNPDLTIKSVEPNGHVYFGSFTAEGKRLTVAIAKTKHTRLVSHTTLDELCKNEYDGLAVWVDGELDFMYGYPNLGPNGHMVAVEKP